MSEWALGDYRVGGTGLKLLTQSREEPPQTARGSVCTRYSLAVSGLPAVCSALMPAAGLPKNAGP